MNTLIHQRVAECQAGLNPRALGKLPSGWVVMGDCQPTLGYCLLLPDPVVPHLNALLAQEREQFLHDMARLGDAVLRATAWPETGSRGRQSGA